MSEFYEKQRQIQALLERHKLDAVLLRRVSNFAWATCGATSYINIADQYSRSQLLITKNRRYLISDNVEVRRLMQEDKLADQRWEIIVWDWHTQGDRLASLVKGLRLGCDTPLPDAMDISSMFTWLRANLTVSEMKRFRKLSQLCAQAMEAAVRSVRPGQSEYYISAKLAQETGKRGVQAIVNLVGTDERIHSFHDPLPSPKKLDRYAMLGLCGRKWGLVCSLTRLIHFGPLPDRLKRDADAVAKIEATFIANTNPGQRWSDILLRGIEAYSEADYTDEWQIHPQGGLVGYEPREMIICSSSQETVSHGQAYVWSPSITGTKSEDTFLVTEQGCQNLTQITDWPVIPIQIHEQTFLRPAILERPKWTTYK
jgi:antitoxin VapB